MGSREQREIALIVELFNKNGLHVIEINSTEDRNNKYLFIYKFDDVDYLVEVIRPSSYSKKFDNQIKEKSIKLKLLINHHHSLIKKIHSQIKEKLSKDSWVLSEGNIQLQAVFGDKKGNIAILYLNKINPLNRHNLLLPEEEFPIIMERKECDEKLKYLSRFPELEIITFDEMWGDETF